MTTRRTTGAASARAARAAAKAALRERADDVLLRFLMDMDGLDRLTLDLLPDRGPRWGSDGRLGFERDLAAGCREAVGWQATRLARAWFRDADKAARVARRLADAAAPAAVLAVLGPAPSGSGEEDAWPAVLATERQWSGRRRRPRALGPEPDRAVLQEFITLALDGYPRLDWPAESEPRWAPGPVVGDEGPGVVPSAEAAAARFHLGADEAPVWETFSPRMAVSVSPSVAGLGATRAVELVLAGPRGGVHHDAVITPQIAADLAELLDLAAFAPEGSAALVPPCAPHPSCEHPLVVVARERHGETRVRLVRGHSTRSADLDDDDIRALTPTLRAAARLASSPAIAEMSRPWDHARGRAAGTRIAGDDLVVTVPATGTRVLIDGRYAETFSRVIVTGSLYGFAPIPCARVPDGEPLVMGLDGTPRDVVVWIFDPSGAPIGWARPDPRVVSHLSSIRRQRRSDREAARRWDRHLAEARAARAAEHGRSEVARLAAEGVAMPPLRALPPPDRARP